MNDAATYSGSQVKTRISLNVSLSPLFPTDRATSQPIPELPELPETNRSSAGQSLNTGRGCGL